MATGAMMREEARPLRIGIFSQQRGAAGQRNASVLGQLLDALGVAFRRLHRDPVFRFAAIRSHCQPSQEADTNEQGADKAEVKPMTKPPLTKKWHEKKNRQND